MMTFVEFQSKSFPQKSVFERPQFDPMTNAVKWVAMRFGYLLYCLGWTANMVDVAGLALSLAGFILMGTALSGHRVLPLLGIALLYFHIFIDFVDGPIAKAREECGPIGALLDNIGCNIDRFALLVLLGIFAGGPTWILVNTFVAGILIFFMPPARREFSDDGWAGVLCKIYCHKYSLLSVRFMLVILPLFLGVAILSRWNLVAISRWLAAVYSLATAGWLILCIPNYGKKDEPQKIKEHIHVN